MPNESRPRTIHIRDLKEVAPQLALISGEESVRIYHEIIFQGIETNPADSELARAHRTRLVEQIREIQAGGGAPEPTTDL